MVDWADVSSWFCGACFFLFFFCSFRGNDTIEDRPFVFTEVCRGVHGSCIFEVYKYLRV